MAQPCFRTSRSRMLKRRSHHAIRAATTSICPNCGAAKQPHAACRGCGYVRPGLQIKTRSAGVE